MIHPIFAYIAIFLLLGGMGMYFANRKVDNHTARQRWLKFLTYILIVNGAIATIFLNRFSWLAILIAAIGLWEILKTLSGSSSRFFQLVILTIYLATASHFVYFSLIFERSLLLYVYFQVFTFDGFSQVTGQLLGRQKLLPQISPSKTLEGLIGGTLFCVVAAVLAQTWIGISTPTAVLVGLITAVFAFTGDSLASYLKRLCQVKDYSHLLPGHGGVLDRFDSLIMVGMGFSLLSQILPLP